MYNNFEFKTKQGTASLNRVILRIYHKMCSTKGAEEMEKVLDRRVLKTRNSLKATFIELLLNEDFDDLTVKVIAEKANIGRKTFYLHYLDKYDLMDAIIDDYFSELAATCERHANLLFDEKAKVWFDFFEKHRLFFKKLFQSTGSYSFRNKFLDFTTDQLFKKADFTYSEDLEIKIRFLSYGVNGIIESFVLQSIKQDTFEVSKQVARLVYNNLDLKIPEG
jgi:AcrR family transcriptional regulator